MRKLVMDTTPADPEAKLGRALLGLAGNAIAARLGRASGIAPDFLQGPELPALALPGATFVTLTRNGELRGCIGSLEARRALRDDVQQNALAAAFGDPRFEPVTAAEWPGLRVEVSLLGTPQTLPVKDRTELLRLLRPGIDGLIVQDGSRRATFLPQVWEQLPSPGQFLARLLQKAGLPADHWSPTLRCQRYEVRKWPTDPAL